MARRGNHEGNLRLRDDGAWEASVTFDGRRHYARATTQAEARRKLGELRRQHAMAELVPSTRLRLEEHLTAWLEAGRTEWKPKTYREYESVCRVYLIPAMGHIKVQALTASHVANWYARWREERGVTGGTVLNVHRVLSRALTMAVRWGVVARNVAKDIEPPRAARKRPELWSPEEARRFLEAEDDPRWQAVWALLMGTGCRVGEVLALRWTDLHRESSTLRVQRTVGHFNRTAVETKPKTAAGARDVRLPEFALAALRIWRAAQATERLAAASWEASDAIVTTPEGKRPGPWVVRNALVRTARRAGVHTVRVHDLRHLHASMLLADGVPIPVVSARLGHASPAVTMAVYSHALKGQDETAAAVIEGALGNAARG